MTTTIEFRTFQLVLVSNFNLNWQFWYFGLNLPEKGISSRKRKNCTYAGVHGCYLLYLTFLQGGRQTQRYFDVSSPSSPRGNKVNWSTVNSFLCKQWYLATFNLEKAIFKPENETIYGTNDHLWRLKFTEYCVQELKKHCRWGRQRKRKSQ